MITTRGVQQEISKHVVGSDEILPSVHDRHNTSPVSGDLLESRHGHVEMVERQITPATVVVRQGRVRGAEVSDCDLNCFSVRMALFITPCTLHLIAGTASQASVEQG